MRRLFAAAIVLPLALSACQTVAGSRSASVDLGDPATRQALENALGRAIGRARVALGPSQSDIASTVTVLPPPPGPHETRSMALPVHFDIVVDNGRCLAVRRDTKDVYELPGVDCRT